MIIQIINQTLQQIFLCLGCIVSIAYGFQLMEKAINQIKNDKFYKKVKGE